MAKMKQRDIFKLLKVKANGNNEIMDRVFSSTLYPKNTAKAVENGLVSLQRTIVVPLHFVYKHCW